VERHWLGVNLLSGGEVPSTAAAPLHFPGNHTNQYDAGSFTVADLIDANPQRPFFLVTTRGAQPLAVGQASELLFDPHDPLGLDRLRAYPYGLVWRLFLEERMPADLSLVEAARALEACTPLSQLPPQQADTQSWPRRIVELYWEATHRLGFLYLRDGNNAEAVRLYRELREHAGGAASPRDAQKWAFNLAIALESELQSVSDDSPQHLAMLRTLVTALDEYVSLARETPELEVALPTAEERLVHFRARLRSHPSVRNAHTTQQ
jgi:hypothetical protein